MASLYLKVSFETETILAKIREVNDMADNLERAVRELESMCNTVYANEEKDTQQL